MLNTILIDDEPGNVRILKAMLEGYCREVNVIGEAFDARQGQDMIRKLSPDLVFLDIEMPYGNAFDLLDHLMPVEFEVVFVTAFDAHILKAFKYSALDYLLKPVNIGELSVAVKKAAEKHRVRNIDRQLSNFLANFRQPDPGAQRIALPHMDGLTFIRLDQIIRCEASGGYTYFHMSTGEKILSTGNIKDYEDLLPDNMFMRIHHSHIINLTYVKRYYKGRGGYIEMEDGTQIEVAIRRKGDFLNRFGY